MAIFKCEKCDATKETRCKPKKCPACNETGCMVKAEDSAATGCGCSGKSKK